MRKNIIKLLNNLKKYILKIKRRNKCNGKVLLFN